MHSTLLPDRLIGRVGELLKKKKTPGTALWFRGLGFQIVNLVSTITPRFGRTLGEDDSLSEESKGGLRCHIRLS